MADYQITVKMLEGSHLVLNVNDKDVSLQCPIKTCYTRVPREYSLNTAKVTGANDLIIIGSVPSWQNTDCFFHKLTFPSLSVEEEESEQGWQVLS